jgi:hypothetical protein
MNSSRDKKREEVENLKATIATLEAENKDLVQRMVHQHTNSIMHGNRIVPPLTPDPSSISIPAERHSDQDSVALSMGEEDDEDDDDDDQVQPSPQCSTTECSTREASYRPSAHTPPELSPSPQYTQALVALTTENASLKDRLAKLEQVVQVLLGMNNQPAKYVSANVDVLSLLGPDHGSSGMTITEAVQPSTNVPRFISPSDVLGRLPLAPTSNSTGLLIEPPTPTLLSTFLLPEKQDHARHPAAMTTILEPKARGSALQRACFSSLALSPVRESREQEVKELTDKVLNGLKKVLEWRSNCQIHQESRQSLTTSSHTSLPIISSMA